MNKYHNSKIYTIRSYQTDKFYIGSTCQKYLCARLSGHKNTGGTSANQILQYNDAYIELLENFKCETREELHKREGELIRQYKDQCVNNFIAGRTSKEYYEDNRNIICLKGRQKIKCPKCDLEINKNSLSKHNKRKHNNII